MVTATLTKWGNSQGIIVPKELCERLGIRVGDKLSVLVRGNEITLRPCAPRFGRNRKVSIEELFEGWEGEYRPPEDYPTVGNEIDWGSPVGREVW